MAGKRGGALPAPLHERFGSKVVIGPDCWDWIGALNDSGYAVIWDGTRLVYAHRLAYELIFGPIARGLHLDHTCHNRDMDCPGGIECKHRRCSNPGHGQPVTSEVNNERKMVRQRLRVISGAAPAADPLLMLA